MNPMVESTAAARKSRFRFTLRAMFIVMAAVAAALGLLIHYAGLPGLFFATLVLCAGWCFAQENRIGALGYLGIFAVFWLALQFLGPYTSLRNRVVWVVGTERLQQWAIETLDNPPPADDEYGMILLNRNDLPEDIQMVAGHHNVVFLSHDGTEDRISLGHGGGFYHWGISVGRPGYVPHYHASYDRIAPGIWGYRE
jgi:hypothetical protein